MDIIKFVCGILWMIAAVISGFNAGFRMGARLDHTDRYMKSDVIMLITVAVLDIACAALFFLKA